MFKFIFFLFIGLSVIFLNSCKMFPYLYNERDKVLLTGIDADCTLNIAEVKLERGGFDSILTIWAMRDQFITPNQAERINDLYFKYIDSIDNEFGIWHLCWAISNYYRLGDDSIKDKLKSAYESAVKRPNTLKQLKDIANEFVNGIKIYYGDAHNLGRKYAETHIIINGNNNYLQSFTDFVEKNKNDKKLMEIIENGRWKEKCK